MIGNIFEKEDIDELLNKGDISIFIKKYRCSFRNIIRGILKRRRYIINEWDIDDIEQNFYLKLLNNDCSVLNKFDSEKCTFLNYIYLIISNLIFEFIKYFSKRQMDSIDDEYSNVLEIFEKENNFRIDSLIQKYDELEIINNHLVNLGKRYEHFINLRYFKGNSINEIAEKECVSVNHAQVILHRAIQELKEDLKKNGYLDNNNEISTTSLLKMDNNSINCTLFTPQKINKFKTLLIQVFVHVKDKIEEAKNLAKNIDKDAINKGQVNLDNVKKGDLISFHLSIKNIQTDEPMQQIVWYALTDSVIFEIDIPKEYKSKNLIGKVTISIGEDYIPIGHINFRIKIIESQVEGKPVQTGDTKWYKHIFISYARKDYDKVAPRVQMISLLKNKFFQDIFHLKPGDNWEKKIYENIECSDAFFLFWSSAARKSKWVRKEIDHALKVKKGEDENPPEIMPVIIEHPPPKPPEELKHLHFNDDIRYLVKNI